MNSCSLGVNAFRSGVQVAARHLEKRCARFFPTAPPSSRCFSIGPYAVQQSSRTKQTGRLTTISASHSPLRTSAQGRFPRWPGIRTIFGANRVITNYVDLPPNYTDEEGLPFAKQDLSTHEVVELFGPHISTGAANQLLRILHGRRVAGTLEDPSLAANTHHFAKEHQRIALEYLRKRVPVDEVVNAGLRAEDELAALNVDGIEKPEARDGSVSMFEEVRKRNQAKREARLKQEEEEKRKREEEARKATPGPLQTLDEHGEPEQRGLRLRMPPPSAKMQAYIENAQSDLEAPPEMTKSQRLLPSAALAITVLGLCLALAHFYRPPKRVDRLFPDVPPAAATVGALILANVVGFVLWRVPPLWGVMNRHFLIISATPRAHSILTALFSHQGFLHLATNMTILWILGVRFHDEVGRGTFLATFFASGAVAGFTTMAVDVLRNSLMLVSLGASGAIYGVMAAYLWVHRLDYFRILGLPPPPKEGFHGLTILALVAATNIGGMFTMRRTKVDFVSHLAGMAVGVLAGYLLEKKTEASRRVPRPGMAAMATRRS
ncbi:hypothetical protein VTK26DRAFT_173 [Humicola hyalothermophila]